MFCNEDYILKNSLKDSHVKGLHSIALADTGNGRMMRMFISQPNGALAIKSFNHMQATMPVAIHNHRRDLTLQGIVGRMINVNLEIDKPHAFDCIEEYSYVSPILAPSGKGGFQWTGNSVGMSVESKIPITPSKSIFLPANVYHTVYCEPNIWSAWLVLEGKDNPNYTGLSYSNAKLPVDQPVWSNQRFNDIQEIKELLDEAFIYNQK